MSDQNDAHPLTLTDIPHILRLADDGLVLDTRLRCTTHSAANGRWFSSMLPYTSRHTLVARRNGQRVVGQFYITPDRSSARIVYLAPHLQPEADDSAWLLMLDAMVREAGRRGAHTLVGELDEDSTLFVTMRQAGFAVYARQQLWQFPTGSAAHLAGAFDLQPTTEADALHVTLAYQRTVPSLMQNVMPAPAPQGFLYREHGQVMGFINVTDGRDGVYVVPYLDHRMATDPAEVLLAALALVPRVDDRPATLRVQRHQGWMGATLASAGFDVVGKQAVMVRHIAAGIHAPGFKSLEHKLSTGQLSRHTEQVREVRLDATPTRQRAIMRQTYWTSIGSREMYDGMSHTSPGRHPVGPNGGVPG
jgi:hypothetical protein